MLVAAALVALLQDPAPSDWTVRAEIDFWYAIPGGSIYITRGGNHDSADRAYIGREIAVDGDLAPGAIVEVNLGSMWSAGMRFTSVLQSGEGSIQDSFNYKQRTWDEGRSIETTLEFTFFEVWAAHTFELPSGVRITPRAGLEYWDFLSRIRTIDAGTPLDEHRTFTSALPMAGCGIEIPLGSVALFASLNLGLSTEGRRYADLTFGASCSIAGALSVTAGYRVHEQKFHETTNQADVIYHGPQLGVELRF